MTPKSIKWRLLLWYGLILVAVLIGFGVTAYQLERSRVFRQADDELHRRLMTLAQQLRRPPRGPRQAGVQGNPPPPPWMTGNGDLPNAGGRPRNFAITPEIAALFDTNDPSNFYFRIQADSDQGVGEIAHSDNYREPRFTNEKDRHDFQQASIDFAQQRPAPPGTPISIGDQRIAHQVLPSGERIEVGCSMTPELHELKMTALKLTGFGTAILFLGLAGGWWIVSRALRPISEISSTAAKISAGELSQRISASETESELGQLVAILNSTFARLETAFAQQKQFASDAAHELRTPLSVILTYTQMALNRERDAASYKQTVEACQRAAQRMRKLIVALLELARYDAGQEVMKRLKFDLSETVADCMDMVQPMAEEHHVRLVSELKPLEMTGDPERLSQVIINLLTNAVLYNVPDGEVRAKLHAEDGLAVLQISDTGKGIAPEDLPNVFKRFYRADKSRSSGGNGLGLSICKAIVEAHGGTIEVTSSENVGTNFVVRLPIS